jgi:hypothetical protein
VLLVICALVRSYVIRELVLALLFFTVIYLVLLAVVVLYILMDQAIRCSTAWAMSSRRAFLFWRVPGWRRGSGGKFAASTSSVRKMRSGERSRFLVRLQVFWSTHAGHGY